MAGKWKEREKEGGGGGARDGKCEFSVGGK